MDYARFNYVAQPGDGDVSLMPDIGVYDKHAVRWGYRPIPTAATAEVEKETLDQWILAHQDDPMYRFGSQQFGSPIDPSSQTEDLGDDAIKASAYGIANLKRIVPNLIEWTAEDGKDYQDLQDLYNQVLSQYNRYMGHVTANVGGVYEYYKTYDQKGAVYTHVDKAHQRACMQFLQDELFTTPEWLLKNEIFNKIEFAGVLDRMRRTQTGTLDRLLSFDRLARISENEALNGKKAYSMIQMMADLRKGIWRELYTNEAIGIYRRNLQRAYIDRMEYLLTESQEPLSGAARRYSNQTRVLVSQSDIRAVSRAQLVNLKAAIGKRLAASTDQSTRYHLQESLTRIDMILDPS